MAIVKWHPYGISPVGDFDGLFNRFFAGRGRLSRDFVRNTDPAAWSIPLDVVQNGNEFVVTASVPGTTKDEIDVSVDNNVLTIRAEAGSSTSDESDGYLLRERRTGTYYRALRLPETVDYDKAESTFKDGVLTIKLPKLESSKARKLEISAA
ncbi:MAG: Hsp20/alpha crystallin family protein [Chloroflexi bacterium]|nr:Hsp20/alpha crystallin family protein [Chloroflexota bacterium]